MWQSFSSILAQCPAPRKWSRPSARLLHPSCRAAAQMGQHRGYGNQRHHAQLYAGIGPDRQQHIVCARIGTEAAGTVQPDNEESSQRNRKQQRRMLGPGLHRPGNSHAEQSDHRSDTASDQQCGYRPPDKFPDLSGSCMYCFRCLMLQLCHFCPLVRHVPSSCRSSLRAAVRSRLLFYHSKPPVSTDF